MEARGRRGKKSLSPYCSTKEDCFYSCYEGPTCFFAVEIDSG